MEWKTHSRTIGACIVGFALVAGAYVIGNFGQSNFRSQPATAVLAQEPRVAITVVDSDSNGIEDWRDDFITTEPLVIEAATSTYVPPTTLTGQLGIGFMEDYIRSKNTGPFGPTQEEVVTNAVQVLSQNSVYTLYDTPDITIMRGWTEADLLTYANTAALIIINNNLDGVDSELDALARAVQGAETDPVAIQQIRDIAAVYATMRDQMLMTPAPTVVVKQHLDLINTYHALAEGIDGMAVVGSDPALALIRLKRYQDDATGLLLALQNMYLALEPYGSLVNSTDPALLFTTFSPEFNS